MAKSASREAAFRLWIPVSFTRCKSSDNQGSFFNRAPQVSTPWVPRTPVSAEFCSEPPRKASVCRTGFGVFASVLDMEPGVWNASWALKILCACVRKYKLISLLVLLAGADCQEGVGRPLLQSSGCGLPAQPWVPSAASGFRLARCWLDGKPLMPSEAPPPMPPTSGSLPGSPSGPDGPQGWGPPLPRFSGFSGSRGRVWLPRAFSGCSSEASTARPPPGDWRSCSASGTSSSLGLLCPPRRCGSPGRGPVLLRAGGEAPGRWASQRGKTSPESAFSPGQEPPQDEWGDTQDAMALERSLDQAPHTESLKSCILARISHSWIVQKPYATILAKTALKYTLWLPFPIFVRIFTLTPTPPFFSQYNWKLVISQGSPSLSFTFLGRFP